MAADAWLPIGFSLPDGQSVASTLDSGPDWQIIGTNMGQRALIVQTSLLDHWIKSKLLEEGSLRRFGFGALSLAALNSGASHELSRLANSRSPSTKAQAMAFALAMSKTRGLDPDTSLHDGIYVEKVSRILPTYSKETKIADDIVLGSWLSGGLNVSVLPLRRIQKILSWLSTENLKDVAEAAGFKINEFISSGAPATQQSRARNDRPIERLSPNDVSMEKRFQLPGRKILESCLNEHVIEINKNRDHYKKLGIEFPPAIILEGPPGCGKTFAVEQLVEFLGWPLYSVDASSIASPYIHETSKKVAEVFATAMDNAPSVVVIDEMEAFLADRTSGIGSSHHRVEEVAEFLRRIPEAVKKGVLIIAMTNRIDMIDQAILRRGRFDHVIKVDYAAEEEVATLLSSLLQDLPKSDDVDIAAVAKQLAGRPLSDVAYVLREGARLAARARKSSIDNASLVAALASAPARHLAVSSHRIGFL
jgi:cell division protease FtsH